MWTRKELKQQAKEALQRNYWRIVLVSLVLVVLCNSNILGSTSYSAMGRANTAAVDVTEDMEADTDLDLGADTGDDALLGVIGSESSVIEMAMISVDSLIALADRSIQGLGREEIIITGVIIFIICLLIVAAMFLFLIAVEALLINPFIVGAQRFMLKSVDGRAEVKEAAYAFDHSYKNVVKTMFCTQLSIFLWALLFFIPGIYKKYQYRMVEYIMAERPDMYYKDAMQMSKDMMYGEKWHAFLLDLSFILWDLVGMLTCGTAHILFVEPYRRLTNAALYRRLCIQRDRNFVKENRIESRLE